MVIAQKVDANLFGVVIQVSMHVSLTYTHAQLRTAGRNTASGIVVRGLDLSAFPLNRTQTMKKQCAKKELKSRT